MKASAPSDVQLSSAAQPFQRSSQSESRQPRAAFVATLQLLFELQDLLIGLARVALRGSTQFWAAANFTFRLVERGVVAIVAPIRLPGLMLASKASGDKSRCNRLPGDGVPAGFSPLGLNRLMQ